MRKKWIISECQVLWCLDLSRGVNFCHAFRQIASDTAREPVSTPFKSMPSGTGSLLSAMVHSSDIEKTAGCTYLLGNYSTAGISYFIDIARLSPVQYLAPVLESEDLLSKVGRCLNEHFNPTASGGPRNIFHGPDSLDFPSTEYSRLHFYSSCVQT